MPKVLCVDDNIALVEVLAEMLASMDYEAYTVTSGQECLDVLKRKDFKPDIILLDIMMSPMDGWATLKLIREDKELFAIPVLMLTGKYPTMAEVNGYCRMFDGYLMKPFALEYLSTEIEKVLDRVRIREEVISDARSKGADEEMLNEYRRLSSTAITLRQFEDIITDGTFSKDAYIGAEKRLEWIKERLAEIVADPE